MEENSILLAKHATKPLHLTHSFPMHLFSTPENKRKPHGFLMFSGVREREHWERMGWYTQYEIRNIAGDQYHWFTSKIPYSRLSLFRTCAISNFFPGLFSIYGLLPYKMSRYLELFFWTLGRITVAISNFPENVAHRNQSMKFFLCVFERVCLIECYFNWFLNVYFLNHSMLE